MRHTYGKVFVCSFTLLHHLPCWIKIFNIIHLVFQEAMFRTTPFGLVYEVLALILCAESRSKINLDECAQYGFKQRNKNNNILVLQVFLGLDVICGLSSYVIIAEAWFSCFCWFVGSPAVGFRPSTWRSIRFILSYVSAHILFT